MIDLIRDSTVGQLINAVSGGRLLPYADQKSGYVLPAKYNRTSTPLSHSDTLAGDELPPKRSSSDEKISDQQAPLSVPEPARLSYNSSIAEPPVLSSNSSVHTLPVVTATAIKDMGECRLRVGATEKENHLEDGNSTCETLRDELATAQIHPELQAKRDPFLVDWDGPEDPDNPRNWSTKKRAFVAFSISLLTFSVYVGSAIYTSSIPSLMQDFGISRTQGALGLTLYVMAYGIGPMFLTPLQELPSLGRNPVYIYGLAVFVLFNIPIITAKNFSTVLAFRFLTGFLGSPALATGGASMGDIFPPHILPYMIGIWALGAVAGPITGPVIGGFAAQAENWRWPIYELMWISGFSLIFLAILLPETYEPTILLKRARRLRKLTGNPNLRSKSEIDQASLSTREVVYESLVRPFVLAAEPAVLFANLYIGFVYSIFYLWFEAFPIVFNEIYHMSLGIGSLPFLGFLVSGAITYTVYALYLHYHMEPRYAKHGFLAPEARLEIGLMASVFIPISLFIFGWTARASVNWIVPVIAAALYLPGIYLAFQSIMMYLAMSYPKYAGSVFAGNDLFRSTMASVFPLFGTAFFRNLGVGPGSSLLAGISIALIPIFFLLVKYGDRLRARSRYAEAYLSQN